MFLRAAGVTLNQIFLSKISLYNEAFWAFGFQTLLVLHCQTKDEKLMSSLHSVPFYLSVIQLPSPGDSTSPRAM
jgi:hypothetical protein